MDLREMSATAVKGCVSRGVGATENIVNLTLNTSRGLP